MHAIFLTKLGKKDNILGVVSKKQWITYKIPDTSLFFLPSTKSLKIMGFSF